MFEVSTLVAFSIAAFVLIVIPGPAVLYVIARSVDQGRLAGIMSVLGVSLGALVHTLAAALGLSAIFATSALAFTVIKYLGAIYLIYLGIITLMNNPDHDLEIEIEKKSHQQIFWQGMIVNLLNPKAALFFLAFLPQFTDPSQGSIPLQIMILGMLFILIALISDGAYALIAGQLGSWLKKSHTFQTIQRYLSGFTYIGLGLLAAFGGSNNSN